VPLSKNFLTITYSILYENAAHGGGGGFLLLFLIEKM